MYLIEYISWQSEQEIDQTTPKEPEYISMIMTQGLTFYRPTCYRGYSYLGRCVFAAHVLRLGCAFVASTTLRLCFEALNTVKPLV